MYYSRKPESSFDSFLSKGLIMFIVVGIFMVSFMLGFMVGNSVGSTDDLNLYCKGNVLHGQYVECREVGEEWQR